MSGDQLVPGLAGEDVERQDDDDLRASWGKHFNQMMPEVERLECATELIRALRDLGPTVVLASSSSRAHHLRLHLGLRGVPAAGAESVTTRRVVSAATNCSPPP